jgi:hypothetical protein
MFIQRGRKLSTHVFLLFNDMFIHTQVRTCLYREVEDSLHMFIQRGRKLSTHVFILFNDMFIHVQVRTCLYREVEDSLHMSSYCSMTCLYMYR